MAVGRGGTPDMVVARCAWRNLPASVHHRARDEQLQGVRLRARPAGLERARGGLMLRMDELTAVDGDPGGAASGQPRAGDVAVSGRGGPDERLS